MSYFGLMKSFVLALALLLTLMAGSRVIAQDSSRRFPESKFLQSDPSSGRYWDRRGSPVGRAETRGRTEMNRATTRLMDAAGRNVGRSQTSGTTTRFYSASGAYEGRSETRNGATRYYDRSGRLTGSKR